MRTRDKRGRVMWRTWVGSCYNKSKSGHRPLDVYCCNSPDAAHGVEVSFICQRTNHQHIRLCNNSLIVWCIHQARRVPTGRQQQTANIIIGTPNHINSPTKNATDPALLIDRLDNTGVNGHGAGSEDNKLLFAMVAD